MKGTEARFEPKSANFKNRIEEIFSAQPVMRLVGARLSRIESGAVDLEIDFRKDLTQQNGFIHAGIVTTLADTACGYAAYTLMPDEADVLSVEFKVNLLSPAVGERFVAEGRVLRAGRTLTVAECEVFAVIGENRKAVAVMLATMMSVYR